MKEVILKMSNEITIYEYIFGFINSIKNKISWFKKYKHTFKNYFEVVNKIRNNKFPINGILKNGKNVNIKSIDHGALLSLLESNTNLKYLENEDELIIKEFDNKEIHIFGIMRNIDAIFTFDQNPTYKFLPVKNKIIVDIGASIGDTSIYFALKGASKVIAIEPYPKNFDLAKKNILKNKLDKKITIILGGAGSINKTITVDPNYESSMRSKLKNFEVGIKVPIYSLETITDEYNIENGILKMDCEECEYEAILTASASTLQKFSHIQIEYHKGFNKLKKKLVESGFKINEIKIENQNYGYISALKI